MFMSYAALLSVDVCLLFVYEHPGSPVWPAAGPDFVNYWFACLFVYVYVMSLVVKSVVCLCLFMLMYVLMMFALCIVLLSMLLSRMAWSISSMSP